MGIVVVVVGVITNLGRGSWGVGHGSEGAKRKCMTGWGSSEGYKYSRFRCDGRRLLRRGDAKMLDARACLAPEER
jgi:hypothetical protein